MPTTAKSGPSDESPTQDEALETLRAALYPDEIIAALLGIGLEPRDLASGLEADERTVRRWLEGNTPNRTYEAALGNLRVVVLYILQRRGMPADRVAQWLRMPNVELDFETPLAAIAEGRKGDVVVAADAAMVANPRQPLSSPKSRARRAAGATAARRKRVATRAARNRATVVSTSDSRQTADI